MWSGSEYRRTWPRAPVRGPHRFRHDPVIGGEVADRVGAGGVAGEQERLAAAPAEVELAPVTAPAGLWHPVRSAKALEEG